MVLRIDMFHAQCELPPHYNRLLVVHDIYIDLQGRVIRFPKNSGKFLRCGVVNIIN